MSKHNHRSQIAAIVLGAAVLPASAFAQARNVNDGGQVAVPQGATLNGGSKAATTQTYYGRNPDDGGTGAQPTQAQMSAATPSSTRTLHMQVGTPAPTRPGRSVNDGGPTN
jgi:hypothetical protein